MNAMKIKTRWIPPGSVPVTREGIEAVVYVNETDGKFYAVGYSGKRTKTDFNYAFKTRERLDKYLADWFAHLEGIAAMKSARKAKKKALSERPNPFKVGDILHYSWGYEQTNAEFWQIVEVKAKSVVIREIGHITVPGSEGFMSSRVKPDKDSFLSPRYAGDDQGIPLTKVVQWAVWADEPRAYLSMDFGSADLITEDQAFYSSWYAWMI